MTIFQYIEKEQCNSFQKITKTQVLYFFCLLLRTEAFNHATVSPFCRVSTSTLGIWTQRVNGVVFIVMQSGIAYVLSYGVSRVSIISMCKHSSSSVTGRLCCELTLAKPVLRHMMYKVSLTSRVYVTQVLTFLQNIHICLLFIAGRNFWWVVLADLNDIVVYVATAFSMMHSATDAARMVVFRIVICPIVWNITKVCARTGFSNFLTEITMICFHWRK